MSRLGDYECWAIFDGTQVEQYAAHPIEHDDENMERIVQEYRLSMHR
ncbi:hypothetical protein [Arthrobacter sp. H14]|nr:hypothetical protein [Arthrobacter sp. H14]